MVEVALRGLMGVLGFYRARPIFRVVHDRGWERFLPAFDPHLAGRRDCGILLTPFLAAWAGTGYNLWSLEVVGDAGTAALDPKSATGEHEGKALASLRSLELDLNQRDTSEPPYTLISLLGAALELEMLAIRCNIAPDAAGPNFLGLVAKAITRRHAIRDVKLFGLHCTTGDLRELLQRIRATLRKQKLGRLELSNIVLTNENGWKVILPLLDQWFDLREVRLRYLSESGKTTAQWAVKGQRDFTAQGRQEVEELLHRMIEEGD